MMKMKINSIVIGSLCLFSLTAFFTCQAIAWKLGPLDYRTKKEMRTEIQQWAKDYCSIAASFVDGFMVKELELKASRRWEDSYEIIQHYKRTKESAESSANMLRSLAVPVEAKDLNNKTISVLMEVSSAAQTAIDAIYNASNRSLFAIAIGNYTAKIEKLIKRLESSTQQSHPYVRERLQSCTTNMLDIR